jgi:hypothetical protein
MEQGLHESSTYFSHHEEVLGIDEFLKVLSLVHDLPPILPPQFLSSSQSHTRIHCSCVMDCWSGKLPNSLFLFFSRELLSLTFEFIQGCMAL